VRRSGSHYVLKVRGNSMVDAQICDGDYVIVNERQSVDNGEMVIAMLGGNSATVKKFYRERDGRIRLQPANETMLPDVPRRERHRDPGRGRGSAPALLAAGARRQPA
jgi:repressor LexA